VDNPLGSFAAALTAFDTIINRQQSVRARDTVTEPTEPVRTPTEKPLEDAPDTDVFPSTWNDAPLETRPQ